MIFHACINICLLFFLGAGAMEQDFNFEARKNNTLFEGYVFSEGKIQIPAATLGLSDADCAPTANSNELIKSLIFHLAEKLELSRNSKVLINGFDPNGGLNTAITVAIENVLSTPRPPAMALNFPQTTIPYRRKFSFIIEFLSSKTDRMSSVSNF
jgi:hypothetical protein